MGDAQPDNLVRAQPVDPLSHKADFPAFGTEQAGDGFHRSGFAGSVIADNGYRLPLGDSEGNSLQRSDVPVADVQILDLKHRLPPPPRPGRLR
ncbi:hypothetical protein D3C76_1577860 [compost metagenome]